MKRPPARKRAPRRWLTTALPSQGQIRATLDSHERTRDQEMENSKESDAPERTSAFLCKMKRRVSGPPRCIRSSAEICSKTPKPPATRTPALVRMKRVVCPLLTRRNSLEQPNRSKIEENFNHSILSHSKVSRQGMP